MDEVPPISRDSRLRRLPQQPAFARMLLSSGRCSLTPYVAGRRLIPEEVARALETLQETQGGGCMHTKRTLWRGICTALAGAAVLVLSATPAAAGTYTQGP